jgi:hypothetical protein
MTRFLITCQHSGFLLRRLVTFGDSQRSLPVYNRFRTFVKAVVFFISTTGLLKVILHSLRFQQSLQL